MSSMEDGVDCIDQGKVILQTYMQDVTNGDEGEMLKSMDMQNDDDQMMLCDVEEKLLHHPHHDMVETLLRMLRNHLDEEEGQL